MKAFSLILACMVLTAGCVRKTPATFAGPHEHSIFDKVLEREDVRERVRQAERDLPSDVHKSIEGSKPRRWNDSREPREMELARQLLRELKPSLKQMSVPELISGLKAFPSTIFDCPKGVAYVLYGEGNQMIIDELKTRDKAELGQLKRFEKDLFEVFFNETFSYGVCNICREILEEKGIAVPGS